MHFLSKFLATSLSLLLALSRHHIHRIALPRHVTTRTDPPDFNYSADVEIWRVYQISENERDIAAQLSRETVSIIPAQRRAVRSRWKFRDWKRTMEVRC